MMRHMESEPLTCSSRCKHPSMLREKKTEVCRSLATLFNFFPWIFRVSMFRSLLSIFFISIASYLCKLSDVEIGCCYVRYHDRCLACNLARYQRSSLIVSSSFPSLYLAIQCHMWRFTIYFPCERNKGSAWEVCKRGFEGEHGESEGDNRVKTEPSWIKNIY